MEQLKTRLCDDEIRGIAQSADGQRKEFHRQGVVDLFTLITDYPEFLCDGKLADRVVGRGAALLLIKAKVAEVFAFVMSRPAYEILQKGGVKTSYQTLQQHIVNRTGDGICPIEQLTANTNSADDAYDLIKHFLTNKGLI